MESARRGLIADRSRMINHKSGVIGSSGPLFRDRRCGVRPFVIIIGRRLPRPERNQRFAETNRDLNTTKTWNRVVDVKGCALLGEGKEKV